MRNTNEMTFYHCDEIIMICNCNMLEDVIVIYVYGIVEMVINAPQKNRQNKI